MEEIGNVNELHDFLGSMPSRPCRKKPYNAQICSLCERLNSIVAKKCVVKLGTSQRGEIKKSKIDRKEILKIKEKIDKDKLIKKEEENKEEKDEEEDDIDWDEEKELSEGEIEDLNIINKIKKTDDKTLPKPFVKNIKDAAISIDGDCILVYDDKSIYLYERTGELKWKKDIKVDTLDTSMGGGVIIASSDKILYCLNNSGNVQWKQEIDTVPEEVNISLDGKKIVVSTAYDIHCFDERGSNLWKYEIDDGVDGTLVNSDASMILALSNDILYFIESETSKEVVKPVLQPQNMDENDDKKKELEELKKDLENRENALTEQANLIADEDAILEQAEIEIENKEKNIQDREVALNEKEENLKTSREKIIQGRQRIIQEKEKIDEKIKLLEEEKKKFYEEKRIFNEEKVKFVEELDGQKQEILNKETTEIDEDFSKKEIKEEIKPIEKEDEKETAKEDNKSEIISPDDLKTEQTQIEPEREVKIADLSWEKQEREDFEKSVTNVIDVEPIPEEVEVVEEKHDLEEFETKKDKKVRWKWGK